VAEAYRHVADGCRHALSVPGLPDVEVEGLRTILRAALQITEQPLLWSVTTTNHQEDRMTDVTARTWDDRYPHGAIRFYEGDDPEGFAAEIKAEFWFDVTEGGEEHGVDSTGREWGNRWAWDEEHGFSFLIPAGLVYAIDGSERFEVGS
jgi:hypothetical protein